MINSVKFVMKDIFLIHLFNAYTIILIKWTVLQWATMMMHNQENVNCAKQLVLLALMDPLAIV